MSELSPKTLVESQEHLLEELRRRLFERNERAVLNGLRINGEVDSMYGLETATVVDEFFGFLRELGLWEKLEALKPENQEREMLPLAPMVPLCFLKTLSGIKAMHALPELLLANKGLMRLVGFAGHVLKEGLCKRGEHLRKGEKRSVPLCPNTIRDNLAEMSQEIASGFFNDVVRALARFGAYGRRLRGHMDASPISTTEKAKGAGRITQKHTVMSNTGEVREYEAYAYG